MIDPKPRAYRAAGRTPGGFSLHPHPPSRPPLAGCAPEVKFLLLDFPLFLKTRLSTKTVTGSFPSTPFKRVLNQCISLLASAEFRFKRYARCRTSRSLLDNL